MPLWFNSCVLSCSVPTRLLCFWGFPGKNTGLGCHSLLQGIFLTQGSNPPLLHWQAGSLLLSQQLCLFSQLFELFATLWTVAHPAPLSMGFSRQEYWSRLPFPSPRDLPNPRIKRAFPQVPALQLDSLLLSH